MFIYIVFLNELFFVDFNILNSISATLFFFIYSLEPLII